MSPFEKMSEEEVRRINDLQRELFDKIYRIFEPPLPDGVPERLERIVAAAGIVEGASVLDVGSGTGIMVPLIRQYEPARIFACDLSDGRDIGALGNREIDPFLYELSISQPIGVAYAAK